MMASNIEKTLHIRHLPKQLSAQEKEDLLKCFGALQVMVMPTKGRYKHSAYAVFANQKAAENALFKLHNLKIYETKLSAEFCRQKVVVEEAQKENKFNTKDAPNSNANPAIENMCKICRRLPPIAPHFGIEYPKNPGLKYEYPEADGNVLINISTALLTVPRFYTQVLHLMNKMNLCSPFTPITAVPSLLTNTLRDHIDPKLLKFKDKDLSEGESEIESDESTKKLKVKSLKRRHMPPTKTVPVKIPKKQQHGVQSSEPAVPRAEVFEEVKITKQSLKLPSKITLNQAQANQEALVSGDVGFGKINPTKDASTNEDGANEDGASLPATFVTLNELQVGRLTRREMELHPQFKKYSEGTPSSRLYIKNLAKDVTQKDLEFIFGRFVNFDNDAEVEKFHCTLMTKGRMRGQAFVGLFNEDSASQALRATNGYQLLDKAMVVCYARSAKSAPKD